MEFIMKFLEIASTTDKANIDKFLGYLTSHSIVNEKMVILSLSNNLKNYDSLMFKLFRIYVEGDLTSYNKLYA
mgnify:CR=1 FL=1